MDAVTDPAEALSMLRSQLDDARAKRGLTMLQLTRAAGLGRTVVSQAFSSSAAPPTKATVCALAKVLRLPPDPLLALLATAVGTGGRRRPNNTVGQPISDWEPLDLDVHPAAPAPLASPDSTDGHTGVPGHIRRTHTSPRPNLPVAAPPSPGARTETMPLWASMQRLDPFLHAVEVDRFVGREWLIQQVDDYIRSAESGYIFLEAEAGLGKTMFMAWLAKTRNYPSHFIRRGDPRSTAAAVRRSLSAQLIERFDLDGWKQADAMPVWAESPHGFVAILEKIADRIAPSKLVILVDGVDEGDPAPGGLPVGLPPLLPRGVFVVAAYRTGTKVDHPETSMPLRIDARDRRNVVDIRRFIEQASSAKQIRSRLAESAMQFNEFVNRLVDSCDGVWVYARA